MKNFLFSLKIGSIVGFVALAAGLLSGWNIRAWIEHKPNIGGPLFTFFVGMPIAIPLGIARQLFGTRVYELVGGGYLSWISWVYAGISWFIIAFVLIWIYRIFKYRNNA